jgi:hypothetical protein
MLIIMALLITMAMVYGYAVGVNLLYLLATLIRLLSNFALADARSLCGCAEPVAEEWSAATKDPIRSLRRTYRAKGLHCGIATARN